MSDDDAARLLRRQLDAELAGVGDTRRARDDLRAALAAAHPPSGGGRAHRTARRSAPRASAVLLAAAAVAVVAAVPTLLADRASTPVAVPPAGPPAGVPSAGPPAPTSVPDPTPSPTPSPTQDREEPVPAPSPDPSGLALDLGVRTVRVGVPVRPVVTWDPGVTGDEPTPAPTPTPSMSGPSPTPAAEELDISWGDGATTTARLPCPDRPGPRAEVPAHTYRATGTYRLEVTGSGGCGTEVPPFTVTVTVTR